MYSVYIRLQLEAIEKASRKGRVNETYVPAGDRPSALPLPQYRWPRDGTGFGPIRGLYKKVDAAALRDEDGEPLQGAALKDGVLGALPIDAVVAESSSKLSTLAAVLMRMERELLGVLEGPWAGLTGQALRVEEGKEEEFLRRGMLFHEDW